MGTLLHETRGDLGRPATREFLERADIKITVVEEFLKPWHVACQEPTILTDAVAAHRRSARRHPACQKFQRLPFGIGDGAAAGPHPRRKARRTVLALVPFIHAGERVFLLMDR